MSAWKSAGITYLQYANICARAVRNSLKDDIKVAAQARNQNNLKFAKWDKGVGSEQKFVVPKAQQ
ncbi:mitochondrial ATP synthase epsilon chain-domain-containing protein [Zychaea mexicana]|uniref:mitochondrial ATP synthase epsilon chain-domain-containing protein n=1 Tax=Zychaea mexicana TaxID=64656 RepID=UPI0022FE2A29|nr:mitochondrial ATP synthase epsilon chain-domain-containing protein [Zychaea mexicana]KAI9495095.1 mitochondrial ATP synthase epsilon chain-domain-containing protein [Zychaea mexicana]